MPVAALWLDNRDMDLIHRLTLRTATARDLPRLHEIAGSAVRELLTGHHYTPAQIQAAAESRIYEVEIDLVDAGTYYLVEVDGVVAGGSGWSAGGPMMPNGEGPSPAGDTAAMRASYVDPRWARRGLATLLARTTETAAVLAGYHRFEALCTPPSAAMRRALGYAVIGREEAELAGGLTMAGVHMRKVVPVRRPTLAEAGTAP